MSGHLDPRDELTTHLAAMRAFAISLTRNVSAADDLLTMVVHDALELDHLPSLRTTSLLGDRTGVVIRGLEQRSVKADLKDEIAAFLDEPDEEAVLVLVSRGKNQVRKVTSRLKKVGTITEVMAPKPWDDGGWNRIIADEFRRRGVSVRSDVVAAHRVTTSGLF